MSRPLTHRPFEALEPPKPEVTVIRRRTTDPESGLKLVSQIRVPPLPTDPPPNARLTPDPSEPDPVAKKKKKAKAKPKAAKEKSAFGSKRAFIEANPNVGVKALVALGKKEGVSFTDAYVYSVRKAGAGNPTQRGAKKKPPPPASAFTASSQGIEALLESMVRRVVASELKRVFSQGIQ